MLRYASLITLLLLPLASVVAAPPQAGTLIKNQASASYRACLDDTCSEQTEAQRVTSNLVQTLVQQVPGLDLVSSQGKPVVPGGLVYFPHVLTNTGNGADQYRICIENVDSDYASWVVHADTDNNGQPDPASSLVTDADADGCWDAQTPFLQPGETFAFVIEGGLSNTVLAGAQPALQVRVESVFSAATDAFNTDEANVIDGPVIEVVKALDRSEGRSPDGPITVSLTYRNASSQVATDVVLEDVLPQVSVDGVNAGMTYVPGSARWTQTSNTVLTDDGDDGVQGVPPNEILYCAYDTGSANTDCQDRVQAVISRVQPGDVGILTFEVNIDSGLLEDDRVLNTGVYRFSNEAGDQTYGSPSPFSTNTVSYRVIGYAIAADVVANNSVSDSADGADDALDAGNEVVVASAGQGGSVAFDNIIWNTGDGTDTFDIHWDAVNDREGNPLANPFPAQTVLRLLKADGATPLVDTDGNGIPDTGPIPLEDASGQCPARFVHDTVNGRCGLQVQLNALLPVQATGGPFEATLYARSLTDVDVTNAVSNILLLIDQNEVDLTNDQAVNGSAPGEGAGPEGSPVRTLTLAPGQTGTFHLYVNNTGARQDNYALQASGSNFAAGQLPSGWQVSFHQDAGGGDCLAIGPSVDGSGVVPAGASRLFCAQVTLPEDAVSATQVPLYFRVESPTSGAIDTKLDAITIQAGPALSLQPDQIGQAAPGSYMLYSHQLINTGNVDLTNVQLSATPDAASDNGWAVTFYEDTNNDGQWDPGDVLVVEGTPLQTVGNDGVLSTGESMAIFARVFAPSSASLGEVNIKTLTASGEGASQTVSDTATDTTTVNNTDVAISKEQALDSDCDGQPDGPGVCTGDGCFVFTRFQAKPGEECVIYRLTAENTGANSMFEVTINDRTQPYTTMQGNATVCTSPAGDCSGSVTAPADFGTGDIAVNIGELRAGEQAVLIFGLRVE